MDGSPGDRRCYEEFLAWRWRMWRAATDERLAQEIRRLTKENRKMRGQIMDKNTKTMAARQ